MTNSVAVETMSLVTKAIASSERTGNAWVKASDAIYGEGVRVVTMVNKEHDHYGQVREAIKAAFPASLQALLEYDKATMKGASDDKKRQRREGQQKIGRYVALLSGYLAKLEEADLNADVKDPTAEPTFKVDKKTGAVEKLEPAEEVDEKLAKYETARKHIEASIAALQDAVALPEGKDATKMIKTLKELIA